MNGQPVTLLAWYRNHALPQGEDLCFSLELAGDPKVVAAQIADMHASGTTLSSDVSVVLLGQVFLPKEVALMNQLIALGDMVLDEQDRSINPIRDLFQTLMERGAEIALRHQAAGR